MNRYDDPKVVVREIVERTGGEIRLALPLGLGKPVTLINELVKAACDDPDISLRIFTALTLERPTPKSEVERRFIEPAADRLFGVYPDILYARLMRDGKLSPNIEVSEFFMLAGRWLGVDAAQQAYISANYTDARDVLMRLRPNVLIQLVAEENGRFSLASNTDISADLFQFRAKGEADFIAVFETNPQMPFMDGPGAVLGAGEAQMVFDPAKPFELFSNPRPPLKQIDHAIGLHAARLVPDGGTLQIGIGAAGDGVAHALLLRHRQEAKDIQADCPFPIAQEPGGPFDIGLHAVTEMLVGGLMELFEAGVVRREADGIAMYAGFFVETREFYAKLRGLSPADRARIAMAPVSFTNTLYGDEAAKRAARRDARFINSAMKVSALGDVMSDSLDDGQVVSGVGGQFDFVQQAFALEDGRSIITLPATRLSGGTLQSNIAWDLPSVTIPRHMRDIVVTEYGIADLRDLSDAKVIAAMLNICDSRFQDELMKKAKAEGKLPAAHAIPEAHRQNLPETLERWLTPHSARLPEFPFGTDFTEIERMLLPALNELKNQSASLRGKARLLLASVLRPPHPNEGEAMRRMGYDSGGGLTARALRGALRRSIPRA